MFRCISLLICIFFCTTSFASVDIDLACKEKKEQKKSLLPRMSTSLTEANLAGQCTGYKSYYKIDLALSCSEFIEQKKSLLSFLSTSLSEANLAGMCVGAIYRTAQKCHVDTTSIDYSRIAEGVSSLKAVKMKLGCYGERYGW